VRTKNYEQLRILKIFNKKINLFTRFIDQRSEKISEIAGKKNKIILLNFCYLLQVLKNQLFYA